MQAENVRMSGSGCRTGVEGPCWGLQVWCSRFKLSSCQGIRCLGHSFVSPQVSIAFPGAVLLTTLYVGPLVGGRIPVPRSRWHENSSTSTTRNRSKTRSARSRNLLCCFPNPSAVNQILHSSTPKSAWLTAWAKSSGREKHKRLAGCGLGQGLQLRYKLVQNDILKHGQ